MNVAGHTDVKNRTMGIKKGYALYARQQHAQKHFCRHMEFVAYASKPENLSMVLGVTNDRNLPEMLQNKKAYPAPCLPEKVFQKSKKTGHCNDVLGLPPRT